MRVDAHQHFWHYSPEDYGWIDGNMASLRRDFLPNDLKPLLASTGFDASIAVQARQSTEETRWLLQLAAENDFVKGVVGWLDLCSLELTAELEQFASDPRLIGVRHVVQDEPDDQFMLRPEFRLGIARLAEYNLTYDLLLHPRHLPAAVKLVQEFPNQPFVLDHIAKPFIADGVIEPWDRDIHELARCANVSCKISGMVTEARWNKWEPRDFRPYLDVVFDAFGTNRLMIGSDWPVCTVSSSYAATMGLVKDYIAQLGADEQEWVLGGNCSRFYGLDE
jgi:L-fuconolactonase